MGQNDEIFSGFAHRFGELVPWMGALRQTNMVHGVSWDGLERSWEGLWRSSESTWGRLGRSGTVLRGLERISGGSERVHGVPKLEIL